MRTIDRTNQFKRDFKREFKGRYLKDLKRELTEVVRTLANDIPLPEKHCDHALTGEWKDHRDCHVKPDWILIYRKPDEKCLQLVRLGSHSELGL